MGRALIAMFGLLGVACGSEPLDVSDASSDATTNDVGSEMQSTDAAIQDESLRLESGGPFLCFGCICDGASHECVEITGPSPLWPGDGGLDPDGGFGDAGVCAPDAGLNGCVPIPPQCLPTPSCSCLRQYSFLSCDCLLDPSGNGLVLQCYIP